MKKILVVEDNKDLSNILIKRLEVEGFSVDLVETGYALLGYLKDKEEPDAVVLDLMLPERSGVELLSTVTNKWTRARIFIFSAHSEYEERHVLRRYNLSGYICKSDGIGKLIAAIKMKLSGSDREDGT